VSRQGHAIVVGASMAGLVAARALVDHFDRVTVVERDRLPDGPEVRSGVPQARHVHVLLLRGAERLESLFPGLDTQLDAAEAPLLDWTTDVWLFNYGAWKPHVRSGLTTHACSRALLEWTVRQRVAANANVEFLEQAEVTGLVADPSGRRVAGVRLRSRGRPASEDEAEIDHVLSGDLIVNAAGRDARTAQWLEALGYPAPRETHVNSHLGYATRFYRPPEGHVADWKALVVVATPPDPRGAVLMPIEGGRWIVTLAGSRGDYPPTDEAGFEAFLRSLPTPLLADTIARASPISGIVGYRRTENILRHYTRLPRSLEGFVSIGDAVCALNPVYGQGMTVAADAASTLDACLRDQLRRPGADLTGLARRYHRRLAKVISDPWLLATGEDLRYPETTGAEPSLAMRIVRPYLDRVFIASREDAGAYRTVVEVVHLMKPPRSLFRPGIVWRVLTSLIRGRRRRRAIGRSP
jgi:flavin-dependent dehydrogenase